MQDGSKMEENYGCVGNMVFVYGISVIITSHVYNPHTRVRTLVKQKKMKFAHVVMAEYTQLVRMDSHLTIENTSTDIEATCTDCVDVHVDDACIDIHADECAVCMDDNGYTSIRLGCGCKQRYHLLCVCDMGRHKRFNQCPMCRHPILITAPIPPFAIKLPNIGYECYGLVRRVCYIFFVLVFIFYIIFMWVCIWYLVLKPSEIKYCDTYVSKCEYFKTDGILVSNTIDAIQSDNTTKYYVTSYYNWTKGDDFYTCKDINHYVYDSYDQVQNTSTTSIGNEHTIFVDSSDYYVCKTHYHWYNAERFYFYFSCLISLGLLIVAGGFYLFKTNCYYLHFAFRTNTSFVEREFWRLFKTLEWFFTCCFLASMFVVIYFGFVFLGA